MEKECFIYETWWINYFGTFYITGSGYNMTYGGEGWSGNKHSNKTKQNMSQSAWCRGKSCPDSIILYS
jgi:hypothetical protein